ncbi:YtxH domain-containing protein [Sorangium sp. So ce1036]|uniref:YtxH domain-containing protein n=1 Tax=Sorangium sp. So ce1036 TaxID=3133328 RepID=UPI003F10FBA5
MSNRLNDAVGTAKVVYESAKDGAGVAATSARATLFDVAKAAVGIATTIRALGVDDALGWVGLSRKRSPMTTIAVFGAGVALGAGVAALLSPTSGEALRRDLLNRLDGLKHKAGDALRQAGREARQAERKVEEKVNETVDSMKGAVSSPEASAGNSHYGLEGSGERGHHLS